MDKTERTVTLRKWVMMSRDRTEDGQRLQVMSSSEIRRGKDGKNFTSVDLVWFTGFLPDVKYSEGCVAVDLTVSLDPLEDGVQAFVYGKAPKFRQLTMFEPMFVRHTKDGSIYKIKWGDIYLDNWRGQEFFPVIEGDKTFPVWVSVKRVQPERFDGSGNNV